MSSLDRTSSRPTAIPGESSSGNSASNTTMFPSPPKKDKNMKGLSLSTKAARKLPPTIVISNSLPSSPQGLYTPTRNTMKPPLLKLERLSISRRPSLPLLADKAGSRTPLAETFAMLKDLQPDPSIEAESEGTNLDVYKEGPVCILPPHLWLYSEPSAEIVRQFDVVINVAEEIKNPLSRDRANSSTVGLKQQNSDHRIRSRREVGNYDRSFGSSRSGISQSDITSEIYGDTEYIHLPWQHNQALAADLPDITALMSSRIEHSNKRVLIHCQQGVSRSASLIIAYIMRVEKMDINKAYAYVKERSPGIGPNMSLIYQLCEWGKYLAQPDVMAHRRSYDFSGPKSNPDPALALRKRATSSADRAALSRTQSDNVVPTRGSLRNSAKSDASLLQPDRAVQPSQSAMPMPDSRTPISTGQKDPEEIVSSPLDVRLQPIAGNSKYNLRPRSAQR